MEVKKLDTISIDSIIDCFLISFENYFVKMPTDRDYYVQRWKAAKVDFSLSYGMFDDNQLVGFIIHAVDKRNNVITAFNTGTGVIPAYRGRRIVKAIYEYALGDLQDNGIEKTGLEVITKNEKAIKAYQGVGFKICKQYNCFEGHIKTQETAEFELKKIHLNEVDWSHLPHQEYYSWDFQKETLTSGQHVFYNIFLNQKPESYFIINPKTHRLAQLDLLTDDKTAWARLFKGIQSISENVSIINVDTRLTDKIHHILEMGLEPTVDQYEMEMGIV